MVVSALLPPLPLSLSLSLSLSLCPPRVRLFKIASFGAGFGVCACASPSDTRRVEVGTEAGGSATRDGSHSAPGGGMIGVDERLVETLVAYKDAVDSRSLLPITFV